jgi:arylsulfatase A
MAHQHLDRRTLLKLAAAGLAAPALAAPRRQPNIIIILADDMGYGDLSVQGSRLIRTPHLDQLAREGVRLTDFYASANVCTPSRAGLLTGRYPIRTGLAHEVIQANDKNGLPTSEITLARALKPDYATALIGKWHLGHVAPHWPPTVHGFDLFFGLPYSHDMKPLGLFNAEPGVELTREDVDFPRLTQRFFARGAQFIAANRDRPFFLTLALTAPHLPINPHPDHAGHSRASAYGDVVQEVDARIGDLVAQLRALKLDRDTLLIFTSDNGPWFEGSAGPLRDRKGGAGWDGGYRVPLIAWAPGRLPAGQVRGGIGMNFDLFPTALALAGKPLPAGVTIDGRNLWNMMLNGAPSPHDQLILFNNEKVAAIRTDRWKYVGRSHYRTFDLPLARLGANLLFDMRDDPAEAYNLAAAHPDVVKDLRARFEAARTTFEPLGLHQQPDRLPG